MSDPHMAWAECLLAGFAQSGVRHVVLSPGSRSTPLALCAHQHPQLEITVVHDERQAGFVALGQARITGVPSVLICTSGTAAGHYLPALLEAREAALPMIVLSADRPWEAQQVSASQTTDQSKLFGDAVRACFQLGLPEDGAAALRAVRRVAAHAVARSLSPWPGGVQLNAPFRKPLEPSPNADPSAALAQVLGSALTQPLTVTAALSDEARATLQEALTAARRVLVLAGPSARGAADAGAEREALAAFLNRHEPQLIAEAASNLQLPTARRHADALLPSLRGEDAPDLVISVGLPPVSTALQRWLSTQPAPRLVLAPDGWADPFDSARWLLPLPIAAGLRELCTLVPNADRDHAWAERLTQRERALDAALEAWLPRSAELSEPQIAAALREALPENAQLMLGNSLPPRDFDVFAQRPLRALRVLHQRGVAGIDGLIASALGSAGCHDGPTALYLGDVSFLHDVGALALLRRVRTPLVVLAVNNDGGRIFGELPVAKNAALGAAVHDHFYTPHGLSLGRLAAGFELHAESVRDLTALRGALDAALQRPGASVIEACVAPEHGTALRGEWRTLARAVAEECAPCS